MDDFNYKKAFFILAVVFVVIFVVVCVFISFQLLQISKNIDWLDRNIENLAYGMSMIEVEISNVSDVIENLSYGMSMIEVEISNVSDAVDSIYGILKYL